MLFGVFVLEACFHALTVPASSTGSSAGVMQARIIEKGITSIRVCQGQYGIADSLFLYSSEGARSVEHVLQIKLSMHHRCSKQTRSRSYKGFLKAMFDSPLGSYFAVTFRYLECRPCLFFGVVAGYPERMCQETLSSEIIPALVKIFWGQLD